MPVQHWKLGADRWLRNVCGAVGITRVAFVTGLDRAGVHVACAIRPRGHVLQVSNGKGLSRQAAAYSAVLEAAELFAAEHPGALLWGTSAQIEAETGQEVLGERSLACAWVQGHRLGDEAPVWVPSMAVFCPPATGPLLGWADARWTSNGLGAAATIAQARQHALLEAIERDQLARALPQGWTADFVARFQVPRAHLERHAPQVNALAAQLESAGFAVHLFQIAPEQQNWGVPVAAALIFDRERGPVPMTAGYCCRLEPQDALLGALLEAAQSRLTDIHGAREDLLAMDPKDVETLAALCQAHPGHNPPRWKAVSPARLLGQLRRAGLESAVAVELPAGVPGLFVSKVLAPELMLSELL